MSSLVRVGVFEEPTPGTTKKRVSRRSNDGGSPPKVIKTDDVLVKSDDFADDSVFLDSFCLDEIVGEAEPTTGDGKLEEVKRRASCEMEGSDPVFESPSLVRTPVRALARPPRSSHVEDKENCCQTPDSAKSDRLAVRRRQTQRALRSHSKISPGPILSDSESEAKDTPVRTKAGFILHT